MKRIMLAAGPWVMNGTDTAERVVAYEVKNGTEIVVHNQHYSAGMPLGQRITFTGGQYFKTAEVCGAMCRWAERDKQNTEMPEDRPHRYASYDFATEANAADLSQQYYREQQNPPGWNSLDDVPTDGALAVAAEFAKLKEHPLNLPELARALGKPEAMIRDRVSLHDPNNPPAVVSDDVAEARAHWDTIQASDGHGVVLTDDGPLAEFFAERFGVQPTDVFPEYKPGE